VPPGAAGDVHDPGLRGPPQRGQEGVGHRHDPEHVRLVDPPEGAGVLLVQGLAVAGDASVVDQNVQGASLARGIGDTRVVGHVEDEQPGIAAYLPDGALSPRGIARTGRGPLHRWREVGTPGLERLRTVAELRSSSWQPETAGARLTSPSRARHTLCDQSCSIIERALPPNVSPNAAPPGRPMAGAQIGSL